MKAVYCIQCRISIKGHNMNSLTAKTLQILSRSGKTLFLICAIAIGVHFIVMCLELFVVRTPLARAGDGFIGTAFSFSMFPVLGSYILFTITAYYLWTGMKKALLASQEKELQIAKEKAVLESTQHLVGIFAQHITVQNAEIIKWVQSRRNASKQVPEAVNRASRNIAAALETLTEAAFIAPYTGSDPHSTKILSIGDIDRILEEKLASQDRGSEEV